MFAFPSMKCMSAKRSLGISSASLTLQFFIENSTNSKHINGLSAIVCEALLFGFATFFVKNSSEIDV